MQPMVITRNFRSYPSIFEQKLLLIPLQFWGFDKKIATPIRKLIIFFVKPKNRKNLTMWNQRRDESIILRYLIIVSRNKKISKSSQQIATCSSGSSSWYIIISVKIKEEWEELETCRSVKKIAFSCEISNQPTNQITNQPSKNLIKHKVNVVVCVDNLIIRNRYT